MDSHCQLSQSTTLDGIFSILKASYCALSNSGLAREKLGGRVAHLFAGFANEWGFLPPNPTRWFFYHRLWPAGGLAHLPPLLPPRTAILRLPHPFDYAQGRLFAVFEGWGFLLPLSHLSPAALASLAPRGCRIR
jgi:hypothetical protein